MTDVTPPALEVPVPEGERYPPGAMHTGPELTVALLLILALAAGAVIRKLAPHAHIPFTIAMLLLGMAAGLLIERVLPGQHGSLLGEVLNAGANVSPHTIMLIFLPALIFESAYGLDVHAFGKDLGTVVLLAVPALIVTTGLTAAAAMGLTDAVGLSWSWPAALTFGALISATDPVAVVAVLREAGAPRRLSVLIEGESLLNDGTAIVLYTVLLGLLTGEMTGGFEIGPVLGSFAWVVIGGLGLGLLLAIAASKWISRTFNDPMVEITLTLVLAYAAMVLGEGVLHVSGVIAVVVAGLWMSGPGRTDVSPEVSHFLHRFWEMLAYVANTLIFFLVGLVIASQVGQASLKFALIALAIYVAIQVIRFAVTFAFRPLMSAVGDPVSIPEATVMSWGGLRGAVSLALALALSGHPDVDPEVGTQVLMVTAGVVLLTILVNGDTTGWLLKRLGFTHVPAAEALANLAAESATLEQVSRRVEATSQARGLRTIPWREVKQELGERRAIIRGEIDRLKGALATSTDAERGTGFWRRALAIERRAYWDAFADGTLGGAATQTLNREVELHLDQLAAQGTGARRSRANAVEGFTARMAMRLRSMRLDWTGLRFQRLSLMYDLYRGESIAAEKVIDELAGEGATLEPIRTAYREHLRVARGRLEDLRTNLPEVTRAIEQRLAKRIELNFEREAYSKKLEQGILGEPAAHHALRLIEGRMKALRRGATKVPLPETAELCRSTELLAGLDDEAALEMARITIEKVLSPGEILFEQGSTGRSMSIVARGAVHVLQKEGDREVLVDILGSGDIVGEMSLLSGEPRRATIVAATTVTLGEIRRQDFEHLMESQPHIREQIWAAFERRLFDNLIRTMPEFRDLNHDRRLRWAKAARRKELAAGERCTIDEMTKHVFVVTGSAMLGGETLVAPALRRVGPDSKLRADEQARLLLLPRPPSREL